MANRCLVLGTALLPHPSLLLPGGFFVDQPRVWQPVGQPRRGVAEDLCEGIIDFDHRPLVICDEEPLLQGIHQSGAERVAIGEILCQGTLFGVTPGPVEKPPGCDIKRG